MSTPNNLFFVLGEWWEGRHARALSSTSAIPSRNTRWLPTPGNVLFTLLMIGLLLWAQSAGAIQLPRLPASIAASTNTIAYQGRLADAAGVPLTGTYNIIFRLYSVVSAGAPLWEEQWTGQNGVRISDGLFNVMLGSLASIPQAVVTGNNTLWLGITVGTDDEMTPRVQLGSVPFAVQALTVPDGSVTTAKIADQAVTQAKLGPDVSLVPPDGSITTAKLANRAVTGQKLDLQFGSACLSSQQVVTVAGNWVKTPVPNMTVTISLTTAARLLIWSDGLHFAAPVGNVHYGTDILLDGNEVAVEMEVPTTTGGHHFTMMKTVDTSSGTHVLALQSFGQIGGTVTYSAGTCLYYLVIS